MNEHLLVLSDTEKLVSDTIRNKALRLFCGTIENLCGTTIGKAQRWKTNVQQAVLSFQLSRLQNF